MAWPGMLCSMPVRYCSNACDIGPRARLRCIVIIMATKFCEWHVISGALSQISSLPHNMFVRIIRRVSLSRRLGSR
eukprot:scaffold392354_cov14-Prasinocladus_malaysianus.AAC.1